MNKFDWINSYFNNAPVAIIIFQNGSLLVSNNLATKVQQELNLDPNYLLDMANSVIDNHNSKIMGCSDCSACQQKSELAIPIITDTNNPNRTEYYMLYKVINKDHGIVSLTIKNQNSINKVTRQATSERNNQITIDAAQKERQRISANLHDSISQNIYSSIMGVKRLTNSCLTQSETDELSKSIIEQLNNTLLEIKDMALAIRPAVLDNFGLFSALRTLAKRIETNSGINVIVAGNANPEKLTDIVQNTLYTIAQESINNVLKHAKASEIIILLVEHTNFITLEIIDDGIGFNLSEHSQFNGNSLGLYTMKDRIKSLNGIFNIHSELSVGTTITVKFPVTIDVKEVPSCITS